MLMMTTTLWSASQPAPLHSVATSDKSLFSSLNEYKKIEDPLKQ